MWGLGVSGTRASDQANKRADVGTGRWGFLVNDGKGESGMRCVDLQRLTRGPLVSASGCARAGVERVGAGLSALWELAVRAGFGPGAARVCWAAWKRESRARQKENRPAGVGLGSELVWFWFPILFPFLFLITN